MQRGLRQSVDWKLIFAFLGLVVIGLVNIYASVHSTEAGSFFDYSSRSGKQFLWFVGALGLAALILFVFNPAIWESLSVPIYLVSTLLLVAVIFLGAEVKGSHSWFVFGPVSFQPAEVSKIATSLLLASIMSSGSFRLSRFRDFCKAVAVIVLPMLIILAENETGSALVYLGFLFVLYRKGLSGWVFVAMGLAALLFILTLTTSSYTAILTLAGVLSFLYAVSKGGVWKWIAIGGTAILLLAYFPAFWRWLCGGASGEWMLHPQDFPAISGYAGTLPPLPLTFTAHEIPSQLQFTLAQVRPYWLLIGAGLLTSPFLLVRTYKKRDNFLGFCTLGFIAGVLLVFSTDFIFNSVLQEHQRMRIEVLLGLKEDPTGVGYNVNQSMIAIGSGGLLGKGFLQGTQTTYGFVPEQSTDFIFCTVGEEWGFVGCAAVIMVFAFLIVRILLDAEHARTEFTRLYGYCVASIISMHLFINIGMTIGLMPVIGIPLPFLSYGGSSLWSFTVMLFIFIALDRAEKKYF